MTVLNVVAVLHPHGPRLMDPTQPVLRADDLGETETISRFWFEREAQVSSHRPYRRAA